MLPIVALIGRPNVGKSTLFNALTRSRDAVVADLPGVTRDRHYGVCRIHQQAPFMVVDTGGMGALANDLDDLTTEQARVAIAQAQLLVFVVDARDGPLPPDLTILQELRRTGKPTIVAINKTDGLDHTLALADFAGFGIATTLPLSASHQRGLSDLVTTIVQQLPDPTDEPEGSTIHDGTIRVTIAGRPNAGKSTLVNRLLGEERIIVSDQAGTTRNPIAVTLEREGKRYTLIDTAGVRRRSRINDVVEKFSVIKTLQSIVAAQVVVMLIDARENIAEQDLTLISHAVSEGKALVIAINKWDGLDHDQREQCRRALERRLVFVNWASQTFISAKHGSGMRELMHAIVQAHRAASKELSSSDLTRGLEKAYENYQPPLVRGHAPKLRFAHPGGTYPPTIVIHGSRTRHIGPSYRRYLERFFRHRYKLEGTPIRIMFREGENPYAGKRNTLTNPQDRKRQQMTRKIKRRQ